MLKLARSLIALVVVIGMTACGNDVTSSARIEAATGGTVSAGSHSIEFPGGSLTADTDVVVRTGNLADYPALEGARPQVLELLPAGTLLERAASVTVGAELIAATATSRVELRQLREVDGVASWRALEFTLDEAGDAHASVTVLAPIAVITSEATGAATIQGALTWGHDGSAVGGATLELWRAETMLTSTTTDAEGGYRFSDLEPGTYTVRGNPECPVEQSVSVAAGEMARVDLVVCGG